ncbi:MAG TPA: hypothetical protein VGX23_16995 [Actinocrinis sp.]|nr:hypothetical protein [Actinocrinis sp.]
MVHGWFEPMVGVDLYKEAGRMREDDLRVREWTATQLATAGQRLSASAAEHRRVHIPAPTREQPFPSREALAPVDAARRCADRFVAAADRVRNAPFPPDPKKRWKQLQGPGVQQLLSLDQMLVQHAEYAADAVAQVNADNLDLPDIGQAYTAAGQALTSMLATLDERTRILNQ